MKALLQTFVALISLMEASGAQAQPPTDLLRDEVLQWARKNLAKRYLAQKCEPLTNFKHWESFTLQDCSYELKNTDGTQEFRKGRVLLILPEPERIASWVVNACRDAKGQPTQECVRATACQIKLQSGAQFPVAGVVLEDVNLRTKTEPVHKQGRYESYVFRDGVTVVIDGIPHATEEQLTEEQIGLTLTPDLSTKLLRTASTAAPARIQGTSRADYLNSGGTHSDHNELMTAWVKQKSDKALQQLLKGSEKSCVF
jgi:hypothetical protein